LDVLHCLWRPGWAKTLVYDCSTFQVACNFRVSNCESNGPSEKHLFQHIYCFPTSKGSQHGIVPPFQCSVCFPHSLMYLGDTLRLGYLLPLGTQTGDPVKWVGTFQFTDYKAHWHQQQFLVHKLGKLLKWMQS
jgi:hypothetical protein